MATLMIITVSATDEVRDDLLNMVRDHLCDEVQFVELGCLSSIAESTVEVSKWDALEYCRMRRKGVEG